MFHAVVYLLICSVGIKEYLENGGRNFIFMILCVLFLFEGEKILRSIFNIKSSANTMGDLAASGALMLGMAKKTGGLLSRDKNDIGSQDDKKATEDAAKRMKNRRNKSKEDNEAARAALDEKVQNGEGKASHGEYQGDNREPEGVSTQKFDAENAKDTVLAAAMKRRLKAGLATRSVNFVAGAAGATLLTTKAMADGTEPGEIFGGIAAGKHLGRTLATPITAGTKKLEQMHRGRQVKNAILSGAMNSELGLGSVSNGEAADLMNTTDYENKMDSQQEVYRQALAAYGKAAAKGGKTKAEIAYYDYLEKNLKNN